MAEEPPKKEGQAAIIKDWFGDNRYHDSLSDVDIQYLKGHPELYPYWMPIPESPKVVRYE